MTKSVRAGRVVWWGAPRRGTAGWPLDDRRPAGSPLSFAGWCALRADTVRLTLDALAADHARQTLISHVRRARRARRARTDAAFALVSGPISRHQAAGAVARS